MMIAIGLLSLTKLDHHRELRVLRAQYPAEHRTLAGMSRRIGCIARTRSATRGSVSTTVTARCHCFRMQIRALPFAAGIAFEQYSALHAQRVAEFASRS